MFAVGNILNFVSFGGSCCVSKSSQIPDRYNNSQWYLQPLQPSPFWRPWAQFSLCPMFSSLILSCTKR